MSQITLTVDPDSPADPVRVDAFTRGLRDDLRRIPGVTVTQPTTSLPDGAKAGELAVVGSLLLSAVFSVQTVQAIAQLLTARIQAKAGWSVKLRRGETEVTLTGPVTRSQIDQAVAVLSQLDGVAAGTDGE